MLMALQAIIAACAMAVPMADCDPDGEGGRNQGHLVEFRLVMEVPADPYDTYEFEGTTVYVQADAVVSDEDLELVRPIRRADEFVLEFRLTPDAGDRFREVTRHALGQDLAVIINTRIYAVLTIRSEVGDHLFLGFDLPEAEVEELVRAIRARWSESGPGRLELGR